LYIGIIKTIRIKNHITTIDIKFVDGDNLIILSLKDNINPIPMLNIITADTINM
jgi:hypothetical protein